MITQSYFSPTFKPDLEGSDSQLESRLRPGGCSQVGFMASNEKLVSLCQADSKFLKAREITHDQIAYRLEAVIDLADYLFSSGPPVTNAIIEGKIRVYRYVTSEGYQPCPFSADSRDEATWCGWGKSAIIIENIVTGKRLLNVTELHSHLVRDHHFFEGHTDYRFDPELAIDVLDIKPGVDYRLKTIAEKSWKGVAFMMGFEMEDLVAAKKYASASYVSEGGAFEAYVLPYKSDWENYEFRGFTHREKIQQEGQEQDKVRDEIEEDIQAFLEHESFWAIALVDEGGKLVESNLDKQVWQSDGKDYLHVFVHGKLPDDVCSFEIAGAGVQDFHRNGKYTVCKLDACTIPVLGDGDALEVEVVGKRKR